MTSRNLLLRWNDLMIASGMLEDKSEGELGHHGEDPGSSSRGESRECNGEGVVGAVEDDVLAAKTGNRTDGWSSVASDLRQRSPCR